MAAENKIQIKLFEKRFEDLASPALIVPVFSDDKKLPSALSFLADFIHPAPDVFFGRPDFEAKLSRYRTIYTDHPGFPTLVLLGAGKAGDWDLEKARQWWGTTVEIARELKADSISVFWDENLPAPADFEIYLPEAISAIYTAGYHVKEFVTVEDEPSVALGQVSLLIPNAGKTAEKLIERGTHLGESVNLSRRLAEVPSNIMTPQKFMEEARVLGRQLGWKMEILDSGQLEKQGFGALMAVARGSENPPFLVIAKAKNPGAKKTVAIIGKGVTFDSGGISLKPAKKMEEMKYDMCGAAAVLGALQAVSLTGLPVNVVAAMPLVENMPSGKASRPGDVVKSYSGKTIQIINTDAEGRLILADTLSYVEQKYKPDFMVDLATLTGSIVAALGDLAAGVFTPDNGLLQLLNEAADISGERIWQLPLWEEYQDLMKSKIADIQNVSNKPHAGSITAAMFLKSFVKKTPWAHIDIAGTAYDAPEKSYRPAGASGYGVRLLWHWIRLLASK